jgi:hypothetical protein
MAICRLVAEEVQGAGAKTGEAVGGFVLRAVQPPPPEPASLYSLHEDDGPMGDAAKDWTDRLPGLSDEDLTGYPPHVVPPPPEGFEVGPGGTA